MMLEKPPADLVPYGMRAMLAVATADGPLTDAAANTLGAAQRALLGSDLELASLAPIGCEELGRELARMAPALRRQLVQGMLMISLTDGPPSPEKMDVVDGFAAALAVEADELRTLRLLADEHMLLFRLHFLRRSHMARTARDAIADDGLLAPLKSFLTLKGYREDRDLAARYRALLDLPEGTLGRCLVEHLDEQGFAVPGAKGGFPEFAIWHDIGHVLTGYGTDPEGEMEQAAWQAGWMKHNPFYMMLFITLTFSAGLNMTPLAQEKSVGILARPGLPERIFHALALGARVPVDLSERWDHWSFFARPIAEVRAALHIEPPVASDRAGASGQPTGPSA
jgi:hypothetical protein